MRIAIITKPKQAQQISKIIQTENKNAEIELIDNSVSEAEIWLKENDDVDILFINYDLNDGKYEEVLNKTETDTPVVLIAKTTDFALSAFQFNVMDYIVTPVTKQSIKQSLHKYKRFFRERSEIEYLKSLQSLVSFMAKKGQDYKERFMVKVGNLIKSIQVEDIAYFFSKDKMVFLVQHDGKKYPVDHKLDELEEMLDPKMFTRANRQFVVGIDSIDEIHPYFKGRVKVFLKPTQEGDLVVSSEKSRGFKEWLEV